MNRLQRDLERAAIYSLTRRATSRIPPGLAIAILLGILLFSLVVGVDVR